MTKGEILAALPKLPKADLAAIVAVAQKLLGDATAPQTGPVGDLTHNVFDALNAALGLTAALSMLPPTTQKALARRLPDFKKFLDQHFVGWDRNKTHQIAFLRMLMFLVKGDLISRNITPTYTTMINHLHLMYHVVDDAFPDYLKSQMGFVILKQFGAANVSTVDKADVPNSKLAVRKGKARVGEKPT